LARREVISIVMGDDARAAKAYEESARYWPKSDIVEQARMKIWRAMALEAVGSRATRSSSMETP
jgi:hypothetical protein